MNNSITVSDLLKLNTDNIIDIRNQSSYNLGHIKDAKNIDSYELLFHPEKHLSKTKTYYLYCSSGIRSQRIVQQLNNMGYHTINIIGGYNNYLLIK